MQWSVVESQRWSFFGILDLTFFLRLLDVRDPVFFSLWWAMVAMSVVSFLWGCARTLVGIGILFLRYRKDKRIYFLPDIWIWAFYTTVFDFDVDLITYYKERESEK